jgi:tripartite ATP-independent transporter DctP family solute receptor
MLFNLTKKVPVFIAILAAGMLFSTCRIEKKQKVLKMAHILDQSHSVHKAMIYMAEQVRKKSNGKLTIQVYPSGQLGNERECLELLQIGSLAMTKVSAAVMEGFVEDYKVLGLPYLFKSKEYAYAVMDGEIGKKLLLSGDRIWLRGLCFYDAGSRSFYTKDKPVRTPDDLRGMKIRVMNSITAMDMVKALGGSPTPIPFSELYTALQSGVVDGAENNPPSFYLSRHYEVCKYYTLDEHTTIPDVLLISSHVWNSLSKQEQKWIQEAADESAVYQRKLWQASEQEALKGVQDAGVQIIYPDKSLFANKVQPVYKKLEKNKKIQSLVDEIESIEINDSHE